MKNIVKDVYIHIMCVYLELHENKRIVENQVSDDHGPIIITSLMNILFELKILKLTIYYYKNNNLCNDRIKIGNLYYIII